MSPRTSRSRPERPPGAAGSAGSKTDIPSATIRTAWATSGPAQCLGTKPAAPAARAALAEMCPAPEISSTRVAGEASTMRSQISAPDSRPRKRSTSATCGRSLRTSVSASSPVRAARHRSTHGWAERSERMPQCTTSWSSTTRTRTSLGSAAVVISRPVQRHDEAHAPAPRGLGPELDERARVQRLERGELQPDARALRPAGDDAVVDDLEHERVVLPRERDVDAGRPRVLVRVAQRLGEDGLRQRLEARGDLDAGLGERAQADVRVLGPEALELLGEGRVDLGRGDGRDGSLHGGGEVAARLLYLREAPGALLVGDPAGTAEDEPQGEEPLRDLLVQLAGEGHALGEVTGALLVPRGGARRGGEGRDLPERPERVALGVAERAVGLALAHDDPVPGAARGHRRAHEVPRLQAGDELRGHVLVEVAVRLDDAVLGERRARDGNVERADARALEGLDRDVVRARGADRPRPLVPHEHHRP